METPTLEELMRIVEGPVEVNDVHSALNSTLVSRVCVPRSIADVEDLLRGLASASGTLCVSGSRHAMGGQQFLSGSTLLDMRALNALVDFDAASRVATFEAGATWIDVQRSLGAHFNANGEGLTFRQKQTGADRLTLGGAVSGNAHGRGLAFGPFVQDVEFLVLVDAQGNRVHCSRSEDAELFALACGGYGLFGVIVHVGLRLVPRVKLRRYVERRSAAGLMRRFEERIASGFVYGDFQFRIDGDHPGFLCEGVFSCYEAIDDPTLAPVSDVSMAESDWHALLHLVHRDKAAAFEAYAGFYQKTHGQTYWSDTHQASGYPNGYHTKLDIESHAPVSGSEMITELYVPRGALEAFLDAAARELRASGADVIYGTVRLIEKDTEAFFTWARES